MSDFPRMLYRDGDEIDVNGTRVDTCIVGSDDEMREALADGWRVSVAASHPLDHDGDGKIGGSRPRGRPRKILAPGPASA